MCDDIEQLDSTYGWLVAQVEALERKWSHLDAQLAASTPRAYYDRVLRKLNCTGDVALLLEALDNDPGFLSGSGVAREHGMGEASTGRFVTLQERPRQPQAPAVGKPVEDATTNTLEAWMKLESKCGSRQAVVDHVQKMESGVPQIEAGLAVVAPEKMLYWDRVRNWSPILVALSRRAEGSR
ncbi:hypothetical protein PR003_g31948 [Phytophthora rubi]|uniref:Uncharacterized protein n=1 Tax=Phytophthora rubi TaxID=129364 RepID=A0A6A4B4H6_9STRA|nr:hypothetical protein PR003_g31948 [Phytophthora rubi]